MIETNERPGRFSLRGVVHILGVVTLAVPLYAWISWPLAAVRAPDSPPVLFRFDLLWTSLSGAVFGFLYAESRELARGAPSIWLSLWLPVIGCSIRSILQSLFPVGTPPADPLGQWAHDLLATLTCGGIVVFPICIVYQGVLRGMDECLEEWTVRASVRSLRHGLWLLACAVLLLVSEVHRIATDYPVNPDVAPPHAQPRSG